MSDLLAALVALLAVVAAVLGYGARQRAKGRRDQILREIQDATDRIRRGRDATADLRGADRDDLLDRLRRNDGRW